mmetsp:Transcript_37576/g.77155  ORF Transcript_37576/g.77155 Transcript_37576/m.77155 type:complete len:256 (-) Transcript_37576:252-1019(-)|eukprot:CAMPEP_0181320152 /NCGR_PEP_ID=MMETSP1101-20121128/17965_1 /TAXON_ID=46948 /ORGANISM="Rhodomonas abbreviata, Strain Caron Lab Isolate" /LENGTH=255 /DNA_ID=CAMNT_0023427825 /DNA_START=48 /DNA_END=815 /DNA_ORIENTATION=-
MTVESHLASANANTGIESMVEAPQIRDVPIIQSGCLPKYLHDSTSALNRVSSLGRSKTQERPPVIDTELVAEFVLKSPIGDVKYEASGPLLLENALHQSVKPSAAVVNLFTIPNSEMKEEYEEEKRRFEQSTQMALEDCQRMEEQEEMKRLLEQVTMLEVLQARKEHLLGAHSKSLGVLDNNPEELQHSPSSGESAPIESAKGDFSAPPTQPPSSLSPLGAVKSRRRMSDGMQKLPRLMHKTESPSEKAPSQEKV